MGGMMYACMDQASGTLYGRWDDERPYTLVDAWRDVEGCGNMAIVCLATGRVVLRNAGTYSARQIDVRVRFRRVRESRLIRQGLIAGSALVATP